MKPLTVFDVRPEWRKRRYFRVKVWSTLKDLRRYADVPVSFRAYALTIDYTQRPVSQDKYLSAEILLAQRHLTHDVITHEALHACLGWAHSLGINVSESVREGLEERGSTPNEERLCYALARTHEQISGQLMREGFAVR